MKKTSEFIKGKAFFGGYPTQETVNLFEDLGVKYFVNLTCQGEKRIIPYTTKYKYFHYPIYDHRIPSNWKTFSKFIIKISNIITCLSEEDKIYIHCKGGHGRSGLVVACILCYMYNISPSESINKTTKYHNNRKEMRQKYREMGSPQTRSQKHFVTKFFEPIYVDSKNNYNFYHGFSNMSNYPMNIPGVGSFPTAQKAYQEFKNSNISIHSSKNIKENAMYIILSYKFKQNIELKKKLLDTGLRPITVICREPYRLKYELNSKNIIGKMIT